MTIRRIAAAAVTSVLVLAGCSKSSSTTVAPPKDQGPATVTIQATEFSFVMPDTIPAGATTLHIENIGGMPHFIEIQSLTADHTDEDITAVLSDPKAPQPDWLTPAPIPSISLLSPGQSTDVTMNLPTGKYAAFCWMPDTNGTPHAILGMHKVFEVTGTAATGGILPTGDVQLTVTADGSLQVPDAIATGIQTLGYANEGAKPTDINVARILVDEPIDQVKKDVSAWFGSGYAGPAPVEFLGGFSGIPASTENAGTTTVNFTPGVYAFIGKGKTPPVIREVGGGGYPSPSASAVATESCDPSSTELSVTARGVAFETPCLSAPADQPLTIMFDNQDAGTTHNVAIYGPQVSSKALFTGELVVGPKMMTYSVDALPTGTYRFQCDVHPTTMTGTLTVA